MSICSAWEYGCGIGKDDSPEYFRTGNQRNGRPFQDAGVSAAVFAFPGCAAFLDGDGGEQPRTEAVFGEAEDRHDNQARRREHDAREAVPGRCPAARSMTDWIPM